MHAAPSAPAQDDILGGKFAYNSADHTVGYRKRFDLGGLGRDLFNLVVAGRWSAAAPTLRPTISVGLELKALSAGSGAILSPNSLSFRRKIYWSSLLGLEARGRLRLALPQTLSLDFAGPAAPSSASSGGGGGGGGVSDVSAALDVSELNLVVKL
jgi:hypothetical protein